MSACGEMRRVCDSAGRRWHWQHRRRGHCTDSKNRVSLIPGGYTRLAADRHLGAGAFTIGTPISQEEENAVQPEQIQSVPPNQRILIVEDEPDAASTLQLLLEMLGQEVHVAHTGPSGLQMAVAIKPDLVLCDIGLPGLDGFAVARKLRESPETATTRLIALTGYGGREFIEEARSAGFDSHITKPASLDDIKKKVLQVSRPLQDGTS